MGILLAALPCQEKRLQEQSCLLFCAQGVFNGFVVASGQGGCAVRIETGFVVSRGVGNANLEENIRTKEKIK